ncbi:DUF1501 domain-containing protein [Fimbriiglobus ruber]|uniref:Sulfatase n=1 Tax=Fimbriiglobus ruber TaxID=1908690 RepID=A0A225DAK5_9BACT|nr:DUF1501 domain-containing protein [Fimbriiglobus ruber]OWK38591.1 hypothetical protein FRUB_07711 [Fimbriiglobus ruber]
MLRFLGSPKRLCNGVTRRDALWAGGLNLFGLTLADVLQNQSAQASAGRAPNAGPKHFGRAKSCILLFLYGSPSQIEFADQKPDAPVEIRGELGSIASSLPGCSVCELLPHTSKVMHHVTVARSLTHKYPIHGVAYATTGIPEIDAPMELNPHDGRHWPFVGSVVSYLERQKGRGAKPVPDNIALPWQFSSQRVGEVPRAGPYAAYLGSAYNPLYTQFRGTANRKITKTLNADTITFDEPYVGITPESTFSIGSNGPAADLTLDRLNGRKSLLEQFEDARRARPVSSTAHDQFREMAYSIVGTDKVRRALDVTTEPPARRDRYGMTLFGQGCLAARRLVEAGSRFVTVFWDEYGLAGSGWDTHWEHYPRMKNELMPGFDRGYAGLIEDLHERGMLDDTLVVVLSEHGRTPKISSARGGGRDHWAQAYTALFAGGGVARGRVVGKTDKIGGTVVDRPISPKDVLATVYHLLGYDLETTLTDRVGRPQSIIPGGQVIGDILA